MRATYLICEQQALKYKTKHNPPVSAKLRKDYDFRQTPSGMNNRGLISSPRFMSSEPEVVTSYTKTVPPKPIFEKVFSLACNGYWVNTHPGRNN